MAKFVLVFHGGGPPPTDEEKDQVMAAWGSWMEGLGDALIDPGNPFAPPEVLGDPVDYPASGYTIVDAEDQAAAVEMAKGNPMMNADNASIAVHEAMQM